MSPEIKPKFPPEVAEEIARWAVTFANLGEDAIDELVHARNKVHLQVIAELGGNLNTEGLLEWVGQMKQAGDVISEVIKGARVIRRLEGSDRTSRLFQIRREAGLSTPDEDEIWCSV